MDGVEPDTGLSGIYVYGPVAALVAHVVSVRRRHRDLGHACRARPRPTRHGIIAVALFSVLGLAAVAATMRLLLRSWRWALRRRGRALGDPHVDRPRDVQHQGHPGRRGLHRRRRSGSSRSPVRPRRRRAACALLGAGRARPGRHGAGREHVPAPGWRLVLSVGFMLVLTWVVDLLGPDRARAGQSLRPSCRRRSAPGSPSPGSRCSSSTRRSSASPSRLFAAFADSADYPGRTRSSPPASRCRCRRRRVPARCGSGRRRRW